MKTKSNMTVKDKEKKIKTEPYYFKLLDYLSKLATKYL
jgi:hypothetical protein